MNDKLNIYQKLLQIQKEIIGLGKDASGFGYKYVSPTKVIDNIKPLMNKYGLLLKQETIEVDNQRIDYITKKGEAKSEMFSKAKFIFTWINTDNDEKDVNIFFANGMNEWEKGLGSAMTYAERYFLLKYFHISTEEDEIDNPDRKAEEQAKAEAATKAKTEKEIKYAENLKKVQDKLNSAKTAEELQGIFILLSPIWQKAVFELHDKLNAKLTPKTAK